MADFGARGFWPKGARAAPISPTVRFAPALPAPWVAIRARPVVNSSMSAAAMKVAAWADSLLYNPLTTPLTWTLSGVVTQGGSPAPYRHVYLHNRSNGRVIQHQLSDATGAFTFVDLIDDASLYFVTAVNPDYSPQPLHVITGDAELLSVLGGGGGGGGPATPVTRAFGFLSG